MNEALLFLHFFGLLLGAGPGGAQLLVMRRAAAATPDEAKTLRSLGPTLANMSAVGIAILWITGAILVWTKWGGPENLPAAFWIKLVFVILLTLVAIFIHMTYAEIRKGNIAAAKRLPRLGPAAGISALLAILFAVIAFQ